LHGDAGDWRVVDGGGDERTVRDPEFRDSHEPLGGDFWLRTGNYRAWRVSQAVVLRTREGRATALPGDWVVEGARGERWPVTDDQFRRSYTGPGRAPADRNTPGRRHPGRRIPGKRPGRTARGRRPSSCSLPGRTAPAAPAS
jgi:hypothetical protein